MTEPHGTGDPWQDAGPEAEVIRSLEREVSLAAETGKGAVWLGGARITLQIFQFLISIVTARLLLPSQFGQAAIVVSITGFAQIFTDLGLTASVVQARRLTEEYLASAFWLNFGSGLALTALFAGIAAPVAAIYGKPQLTGLILVASSNFILSNGAVQTALLERTFHFRRIAIIETAAYSVGAVAVPILAALGFGSYSLVVSTPIISLLLTAMLFWRVRWLPRRPPRRDSVLEIWRFARGLVAFNSINYWSRNLDNVLLGAMVSEADLGNYARAYTLMGVPIQQSTFVLDRVMYPALVRMRGDAKRMGDAWSRAMAATCLLSLPLTLTMAATAPALVAFLYGHRWIGMTTILELLSVSAVPTVIAAATGGAFRAANKTDLLPKLGLATSGLTAIAIVAGLPWGTTGVATALLIRAWLGMPLVLVPLARAFEQSVIRILRPSLIAGIPAGALLVAEVAVRLAVQHHLIAVALLVIQLAAGSAAYLVVLWFTHRQMMITGLLATRDLLRRRLAHARA